MIVPQYWAAGRIHVRAGGGQITVRRFGWSDSSMEEAQAMADARAREALARIQSGEKLDRRERKTPYNGAEGVPIREEIVARHGETILTRNSYGAVCLNTPDVMFVDIDLPDAAENPPERGFFGWVLEKLGFRSAPAPATKAEDELAPGLNSFLATRSNWHLRVYATPAGFRILAMHRTFSPSDKEAAECFRQLNADETYTRMCVNQHCFRARLTPKPWRIGMGLRLKPNPGVWPIDPGRLPARRQWVREYEERAAGYASCRFLRAVGDTRKVDAAAERVRALHDELCRAYSELPLA